MSQSHPEINQVECKGCCRCIEACPKRVLVLSEEFNQRGYRVSRYIGEGCVGCGQCYYACPEPYTIRVIVGGDDTADTADDGGEDNG